MKSAMHSTSDWTLVPVLHEASDRCRKAVAGGVAADNVPLPADAQRALLAQLRALGETLAKELLPQIFGETDFKRYQSEAILGSASDAVKARMPLTLAPGYKFASVLRGMMGTPDPAAPDPVRVCAVFNCGISLLDVVCDHSQDLQRQVSGHLTESTVMSLLAGNERTRAELLAATESIAVLEVRLVLKIIIWLLAAVHELSRRSGNQRLPALMVEAYRAELRSFQPDSDLAPDALDISRSKSVLPSVIMLEIVASACGALPEDFSRDLGIAVTAIGTAQWLMDDLQDLLSDLQSGQSTHC